MANKKPDLSLLEDAVASKVLDAMRAASLRLTELGVRHLLVGGLAVGAYGHPRGTTDVDFLVGDEAFEHHAGGFVTMKPGMPIQVGGVAVDFLSAQSDEPYLEQSFPKNAGPGVPVAAVEVLAYLKLKSPRQKDLSDLVELIKAGIDTGAVTASLQKSAPHLLAKWNAAIETARVEDES